MNHSRNRPRRQPSARAGFSLIELLVVIVILGILMSLLLPAVNRSIDNARTVQVSTEITQMDQAIASFKTLYGVEPPSNLLIPPIGGTWDAASRSTVRSIWPQFDFASNGGLPNGTTGIHLNGAECLVFFLGGVETGSLTASPKTATVIGFSKNPLLPWSPAGTNREGPFFEFDPGRFVNIDNDLAFEFIDTLPDQKAPYLYLGSQGENYTTTNTAALDDFDVHGGSTNPDPRDLQGIYFMADGTTAQRSHGYQIISPGVDGLYGIGGPYVEGTELTGPRKPEADNITNFSGGRLSR